MSCTRRCAWSLAVADVLRRCLLVGALLGALEASGAPDPRLPSWPQYRFGPAHTGASPYEHLLTRSNVGRLRLAWAVRTGGEVWSSPAVGNGIVYIGSNDKHVYALRATTGAKLWRAAVGGDPSAPALVGSELYVSANNAFAYAFNAATGKQLWRTNLLGSQGAFPAAPTVAGGAVYVMDDGLVALDASTGMMRWRLQIDCFSCPVAFANGTVYTAATDPSDSAAGGRMYALDPATGKSRWATSLGGTGAFTPAVAEGIVYVGIDVDAAGGIRPWSIAAFDAATGRQLWRSGIGRSKYLTWASAAVTARRVVFPSPAGRLVALDAKTGRRLWSVPFRVTDSAPAIANGVVYVGSTDKHLYAFDIRTGRQIWRAATGGEITSSPTIAGGTVIVGSDDGVVRAFRLRSTR
ncbi:MAG: hypothetical protein E6G50_04210 [Actinobacteria bacterium]|nr:MAG: hypothetical protein E6G50_04210 [Actinomycetota bacterium]